MDRNLVRCDIHRQNLNSSLYLHKSLFRKTCFISSVVLYTIVPDNVFQQVGLHGIQILTFFYDENVDKTLSFKGKQHFNTFRKSNVSEKSNDLDRPKYPTSHIFTPNFGPSKSIIARMTDSKDLTSYQNRCT